LVDRKGIWAIKLLLQNPWDTVTVVNVSEWGCSLKYHVDAKSFGLSHEDAEDEDEWRLSQGDRFSWRMTINMVCVCVY